VSSGRPTERQIHSLRHAALIQLAHARMDARDKGDSPEHRKAIARLERRIALLTAQLPVIHDLSQPGEPVTLEADQEIQDQADAASDSRTTAQNATRRNDSPQPEQPNQHQDQQPTA